MPYLDCSDAETKEKIDLVISKLKEGVEIASDEFEISNLLYNESYVSLMIASVLGHQCSITTQGSDAMDENDNPVEYKFVSKREGTYTGLSFQFHWLSTEKIAKYQLCTHFYFAWRNQFEIEKIIRVNRELLMEEIEAKAPVDGSTGGHKSFGVTRIEGMASNGQAVIVYPQNQA